MKNISKIVAIFVFVAINMVATAQNYKSRMEITDNIGSLYKTKTDFKIEIDILKDINDSIAKYPSRYNDSITKVNLKKIEAYNKGIAQIDNDIDSLHNVLKSISPFDNYRTRPRRQFRSHFSGIFVGINNYFNPDKELNNPAEDFLKLNTNRSVALDIFFARKDIQFSKNNGLTFGLDLKINHYSLEKNFNLKISDDKLIPDYANANENIKRQNLRLIYLSIPMVYEVQIPSVRNKKFYFNAGISGGLRIGERTKQIIKDDGERSKNVDRRDFNTRLFRYNLLAGLGYNDIEIFSMFSPQTLFKSNKNSTLYPFEFGIKIAF